MNNKEYLEYLIQNYIKQHSSKEGLKEYLEEMNRNIVSQNIEGNQSREGKAKQKTLGSGKVTGGLNMYPEYEEENTIFNQQGLINFCMLGLLTFFFEILFISLALCIY